MTRYIKFRWSLTVALFVVMCVACSNVFSMKANKELKQQLSIIRCQNKGKKTDWGKLESECLKLITDYNSPADRGKIYATIALIYSEKGYSSSNDTRIPKGIKYCKKALEHPLDVVTACKMYGRWADSLMLKHWGRAQEEFVKGRQKAITPCLTGLKLALDNKAPKKRQKLPVINLFDYDGPKTDPVYQDMLKKHEEQVANYKKVKLQNELYKQRKALTQRCISLYLHEPYNTEELRHHAEQILKNYHDVVEEFTAEIKAKIKHKQAQNDAHIKDSK